MFERILKSGGKFWLKPLNDLTVFGKQLLKNVNYYDNKPRV